MTDIKAWLESLGLSKYFKVFEDNEIDGEVLPQLTDQDLRELGLPLGPRKKLLNAIATLRPDTASANRPVDSIPKFQSPTPRAYTPRHLAEKILNARSTLEGERKQVTILFADIKGSTALVDGLDPEQAATLLDPALSAMMDAVHRYEGTVNRVQGDGLMAMFGAPIAHEDHAVRACRAALDLQQTIQDYAAGARDRGFEVRARVGLHSGEVVVRAINNDLSMNYDASGVTAHLAARMEQLATPDSIRLTADTLRLAEGYIEVAPLGPTPVKGLAEPVEVFELSGITGARSRLQAALSRGLTPFVGRERELNALHERFAQSRSSHGQVVFLVGEPGIGKSRLLYEFRQQLGEQATWAEGHTISFGQAMALHPLIDLLRGLFRIDEDDTESEIIDKITRSVLRLDASLHPVVPYLRYLLAVDPGDENVRAMDPKLRRAEIFDALRRLMLHAAEARPQVLVFEDLHWIDQASEEFLTFIADSLPNSRVLCLFTYRPGYRQPFGERTFHTRLVLPTLSEEDTARMTREMLATEHLPQELQALISKKAEGNPFFVEEVIKSLREVGAIRPEGGAYALARPLAEIVVPDTIRDVLMARIDRLEEAPKKTLQLASVIGREFTRRLLDRLADIRARTETYLQELKAIELIYEKSLFPELAYMFKHALTQDVAYGSLLMQRRKELHRLIGRAIEELYADRLAEHYEILAYHFAKGEDWTRALGYFLKAAGKAVQAFTTGEALALYDQALVAARQLGDAVDIDAVMTIHRAKADLYFALSDFKASRRSGQRLRELARQAEDRVTEGEALAKMGLAALYGHDFDQALADAAEATAIAETVNASAVQAAGHFVTGAACEITGRHDRAQQELERALTHSRAADDYTQQSFSLLSLGALKNWQGEYAAASRFESEGLQIARDHKLLLPLSLGLFVRGVALGGKGDYDQAVTLLEEGLELSSKVGDEFNYQRHLNTLGWLYSECGDLDLALKFNRQAREISRRWGDPETIANAELNLGDVFLARGELAQAFEFYDSTYRLASNPKTSEWMKWRYSTRCFASLARYWLARGDLAKAEDFANRCLDKATRTISRKYLVQGWRLKGEIACAKQHWDDARTALEQALATAIQIGNPPQLWQTHFTLGHLFGETGHPRKARQAYRSAREIIDGVKAGVTTPELCAGLEDSPLFQQIYELSQGVSPT